MKFVAAARLRRAQEAALAARPYAQELARVLRSTMARIQEPQHPLLERREEKNVLVIVLTGERGLAGAFNANILRKANEFFRANREKKIVTVPVGKKGRDSLKKAGFTFAGEWVNVLARVEFKTAREIAKLATDLYAEAKVDSVYIIFSEFKSVMAPTLTLEKLLPVEAIGEEKTPRKSGSLGMLRKLRSTTSTSSRKRKYWTSCCRATSRRRFCAPCWNRRHPNMRHA